MAMTATGMASKILAAQAGAVGGNSGNQMDILTALCQGIIDEIVQNSELVPLTTDTGDAGAGIITGKLA